MNELFRRIPNELASRTLAGQFRFNPVKHAVFVQRQRANETPDSAHAATCSEFPT